MNQEIIQQDINMYRYVDLDNQFMNMAYQIGKALYKQTEWNLKTIPVAIIVKDGKFISAGLAGYGRHALDKKCDRLNESGTPYFKCKWCMEEYHAEQIALNIAGNKDLNDAELYLYGHFRLCKSCIKILNKSGISKFALLKKSDILFDRHNTETVLGTKEQFMI